MPAPKVSEAEFISLWNQTGGSAAEVARQLGIDSRDVLRRRRRIESRRSEPLLALHKNSPDSSVRLPPGRITQGLENGTVIVGSDVHIWPGELTTAQRAFIRACKDLKPSIVIINGDVFDGARISRHPTGIWSQEARPSVKQELDACHGFLDAVYKASSSAKHYWLFGNHDARLEARLSAMVPEYEGVPGFALKDHFPEWAFGMSLWLNDVVVKHRAGNNGLHATYQNALKGGRSIVTGHLHSLKVTPWTDYNGTRYGVDTGTLADPDGPQFDYTEDNAKNWRSGFAVLTFRNGRMLMPELVQVCEGGVEFRGRVWEV